MSHSFSPEVVSRCSLCPRNHALVPPCGPTPARVALIGEGPGKREDAFGRLFIGPSGQEQDETYFRLAGLDRSEVFITNAVQCRQERNNVDVKPGTALLACCSAHHLPAEIQQASPQIVVLAGASAVSLVKPEETEDGRKIDLDLEHGFPQRVAGVKAFGGWSGWVVPMYHPAAGMHDSARYMTPLLLDWERLGLWMRGKWERPKERPKTNYQLVKYAGQLEEALDLLEYDYVPIDTESDEGRPYSVQFSPCPGRAYFIKVDDKRDGERPLDWFAGWFEHIGARAILHNAAYDLEELYSLGIKPRQFRDTMQELYHLGGSMPQGLKAAVYRAFGFRMTSYDEVVTPHSLAKLQLWLTDAYTHVATSMRLPIPHPAGADCPTCGKTHRKDVTKFKAHESEAVLKRIMSKVFDDGCTYDPWQKPTMSKGEFKARLLGRDWLEQLEQQVGRMPRPSIVHAPLDQQVQYGCGDADWTGRLAKWLEHERERIVQQEWLV
jgi:uracil-DNA glycosylase family 4